MPKPYTRRLSTTEVKEGFILIQKDKLKLFPEPGQAFNLRFKDKDYYTRILPVRCTCQGPDKPHCHWRLDASGFIHLLTDKRPSIKITKAEDTLYELELY
ncbi:hypothetical protein JXM67_09855 [candidate division WOR-3 bacterium]|nr:hypothetical protein [candidate division WOR-3 bacterium]